MHRALLVEDILARVVDELGPYANCALARTCRSFTELALDALWADRVEILPWGLAHLMSDELWTVYESPVEEGAEYMTLEVLTFADGVDTERISHFGDRFAYYTKRMRTFTLHQDHYGLDPIHHMVHPTVLVAWGWQHSLFPLLRELSVCGHLSRDSARDEEAFRHFLRAPSLTSLEVVTASKLCNFTQDSVDALLHACVGLRSVKIMEVSDEENADVMDTLQSWPRLLHKIVARAAHMRALRLEWNIPVQWETVVHLAAMPTIQELSLCRIVGVPASPSLHVGAPFSALHSLCITDETPHICLLHTLFRTCAMPHLTYLDITIQDYRSEGELQVSEQELHSLLALVGRHHTGLTYLSVVLSLLLPNADICVALPPLPHLTHLCARGWYSPSLDFEGIRRVLALYPQLEHWTYQEDMRKLHAPVSLSELLDLLHPYPSIEELPVVITSADLPSEETIAQFGTHRYGPQLDVQAGVPIADLDEVVSRIFPHARLKEY